VVYREEMRWRCGGSATYLRASEPIASSAALRRRFAAFSRRSASSRSLAARAVASASAAARLRSASCAARVRASSAALRSSSRCASASSSAATSAIKLSTSERAYQSMIGDQRW
jgi:hypothetical protein